MTIVDKSTDESRTKAMNYGERSFGHVLARKFTFADFAASADVLELIPVEIGEFVKSLGVLVTTVFDGTPVLLVGDGNTANGYLASGEINEEALNFSDMGAADVAAAFAVKGARPVYTVADTIDVKFSWSTTPTTGEAVLIAEIAKAP